MNMQRSEIRQLMLYEFKRDDNATDTTKNIPGANMKVQVIAVQ